MFLSLPSPLPKNQWTSPWVRIKNKKEEEEEEEKEEEEGEEEEKEEEKEEEEEEEEEGRRRKQISGYLSSGLSTDSYVPVTRRNHFLNTNLYVGFILICHIYFSLWICEVLPCSVGGYVLNDLEAF